MRNIGARPVRLALVASLLVLSGVAWMAPAHASSFGGRAYSAYVNVLGAGPLYIADTGALPADGGWSGATLEGTAVPGVLSAETLVAATSGALTSTAGDQVNSLTSLANVVVLPGQAAEITASFVQAQADATDVGPSGGSQIDGLTFGGVPVQVTGLPNQTISLPGVATLVINEQTTTLQGIVVNALHLILSAGGEIVVSSASSSISQ
ncbi:MAG: hypothetical protein HY727_17680 [Candidatus Rokubacteria bacterium]|nr:hypothetical protein [Candidatus Rokubacteria bacterium]